MAQIRYLIIVAVIFTAAFGVSALLGIEQMTACLWALLANAVAVCGGFVPAAFSSRYRPSLYPLSILAAGVIRLLITAGGAAIILVFVEVGVLWFVAWLSFFYLVVLVVEVCFVVRTIDGRNQTAGL